MLLSYKARTSARRHSRKSDGVCKVRSKSASGAMTLGYKNQFAVQTNESPESTEDKIIGETCHNSSAEEPNFESLPELFECQGQFSILEDGDGNSSSLPMQMRLDFSSYNFWTSVREAGMYNAIDLSDTFSCCEDVVLELAPDILDAWGFDFDNFPAQNDPHYPEYSVNSPGVDEEITNRMCYWHVPLELEEDIFECTSNCPKMLAAGTDDRGIDGVMYSLVDKYLVNQSPDSQFCNPTAENLDSNLLVYTPNRYVEDACIFQSSPGHIAIEKSDAITLRRTCTDGAIARSQESQGDGSCSRVFQQFCCEDRRSSGILCENFVTLPRIPDSDGQDGAADEPSETHESAHRFRYMHHSRGRLSVPIRGIKRSRLLKPSPIATSFEKRSPTPMSNDINSGAPDTCPIKKAGTVRRFLKPRYSSESSAEESNHSFQESPGKTPRTRQISVAAERKLAHQRVDTSLGESADRYHLRELSNYSSAVSGRMATTTKLTTNPSLLRKKRTTQVRDSPKISGSTGQIRIRTRISTTRSQPNDSPQISSFTGSTPRDSPMNITFRRSPRDGPKKIRVLKRSRSSSPTTSANSKKMRFHKFKDSHAEAGTSQLLKHSTEAPVTVARPLVRSKKAPLPRKSVEILQGWLTENLPDPYPSREEKEELIMQTGLKVSQIGSWLGNARQKLKLHKSRIVKDLSA